MFFVFGSPRSGTTLLTSILNLHTKIVIPDETDFIVPLAFICDRVADAEIGRRLAADLITSTERYPISIGEYLAPDDIANIVQTAPYDARSIVWAIYEAVAVRAGKRLAGDKRPNDIMYLPILRKQGLLDRNCKIIHLVRDPRDVYLSLEALQWPTGPQFMLNWSSANERLYRAFREDDDRYLLIRYEDLVTAPQKTVQSITNLLGVEWQADMLDHQQRGGRYADVAHHKNVNKPISDASIGKWRCGLTPPQRDIFQGYEHVLGMFGYKPNTALGE